MVNIQFSVRDKVLANGMRVLAIERPSHPVVSAMIWYRVGSRNERTAETGVSHFLEHMLFKGTHRIAKGEIDAITARLGGVNNAFTDYDYTAYYFNFARDRWETAFAIEAERMRGSLLDTNEFEREKNVVLEEMRMGEDDPWRELAEAVSSAAFHVHPYHHPVIGWKRDLEMLTVGRMRDYYHHYYQPANAVLVVAGDVKAGEVFESANRYFGKLTSGAAREDYICEEPEQRGERRIIIERDTPVRRLMIAYRGARCGEMQDYTFDVLGAVLASGHASRLYKKLVKDLRLAVHVSAENEARLDPGLFWISVEGLDGVGRERIEEALFSEIVKLQKTRVTDRELRRAKKLILAGQAMSLESAAELADRVGRLEILHGWRYVLDYRKKMEAVTAAELQKTAEEFFDERRRTVGWSIPKKNNNNKNTKKSGAGYKNSRAFRRLSTDMAPAPEKSKFIIPPRRSARPVVRLDFDRAILSNGLTVLATRNAAAPTVSLTAYVNIGVACEPESKAGIENLTGSLLQEGSRQFSGDEIALQVEESGGFLESGSRGVSAGSLADALPLLLKITGSVLREPSFTKEAFDRVKEETVSDLIADEDDSRGRAFRKLRELVYGKHPWHRPADGYVHTVRKLQKSDAIEFYKQWYAPSCTILSVAGDVDPREVIAEAKLQFAKWKGDAKDHPAPPPIPEPRALRAVERIDRAQVHIAVGHAGIRRVNPDYYALLVLDHVLGSGSGFTDRMSKKLRDEEGLAYGVNANITNTAGREPGFFAAYLSTEPKNTKRARKAILREIRRIITEPPTDLEVRNAKDYLIGSYAFALERNSSRAHALATIERFHLGDDYFEQYAGRIENITTDDVVRAANEYIFPDRCAIVEVGAVG